MASLNASTACCTPTLWNRPTPATPLQASNPRGSLRDRRRLLCNKFLLGGGGGSQHLLLQPQRHGSSCTSAHRLFFVANDPLQRKQGVPWYPCGKPLAAKSVEQFRGLELRLASNQVPLSCPHLHPIGTLQRIWWVVSLRVVGSSTNPAGIAC
jgi:hypothetical protein